MRELVHIDILLVEDNDTDAELTIRALRRNNLTNNIVWLKDGAEAIDFIFRTGSYQERPDTDPGLVLLDLKLPKVDGIQVLRQIKSNERSKSIPVVVLTSSAEEKDLVDSYRLGVNSYIVKPVDFEPFLDVIARAGFYWAIVDKRPW